jgi:hypothetical protein
MLWFGCDFVLEKPVATDVFLLFVGVLEVGPCETRCALIPAKPGVGVAVGPKYGEELRTVVVVLLGGGGVGGRPTEGRTDLLVVAVTFSRGLRNMVAELPSCLCSRRISTVLLHRG